MLANRLSSGEFVRIAHLLDPMARFEEVGASSFSFSAVLTDRDTVAIAGAYLQPGQSLICLLEPQDLTQLSGEQVNSLLEGLASRGVEAALLRIVCGSPGEEAALEALRGLVEAASRAGILSGALVCFADASSGSFAVRNARWTVRPVRDAGAQVILLEHVGDDEAFSVAAREASGADNIRLIAFFDTTSKPTLPSEAGAAGGGQPSSAEALLAEKARTLGATGFCAPLSLFLAREFAPRSPACQGCGACGMELRPKTISGAHGQPEDGGRPVEVPYGGSHVDFDELVERVYKLVLEKLGG